MSQYDLVVVMPVFNEEDCVAEVVRSWRDVLSSLQIRFRLVVLNDGSGDGTRHALEQFQRDPHIEIVNKQNSGHGPTILMGYARAVQLADWVFQCDSDDEMKADSFIEFWKRRNDYDALFGFRAGRSQSLDRKLISAASRIVVRVLHGGSVRDVNAPYRLMRSSLLRGVVDQIPPDTFAPNLIISAAFARSGARICNHAIPHTQRRTGTVSLGSWRLWRGALRSFLQTLAARGVRVDLEAGAESRRPRGGASPRMRKISLGIVRIGLATVLLLWLALSNRLDFRIFASVRIEPRSLLLFGASALSVLAGLVLLAFRLGVLLRHKRIPVSFARSLGLTFVGALAGAVLPGLVGGDAVKAIYLCGDAQNRRSQAVAAVMVDRIIGLYSLFLLASIAAGLLGQLGTFTRLRPALIATVALTVLLTFVFVILSTTLIGGGPRFRAFIDRLPPKLRHVLLAFLDYLQTPSVVLRCIGLSMVNHLLVILVFVVAGELLRDGLPLRAHFMVDPLAMALNAVPLTPGGVGLAEGAFSYLYLAAMPGSANGAAVGLLGRLIQYIVFAIGGAVSFLFVRPGKTANP